MTWFETRAVLLWNCMYLTQAALFLGGFLFLLWSLWPVIYLMVLLASAGVVGFAGKAPFHQGGQKGNRSHAQELAKQDF